jgi:hypothetical protein
MTFAQNQLELNLDLTGVGSIKLGGESIENIVTGMDITVRAGELTKVTIHTFAPLLANVDAMVATKIRELEELDEDADKEEASA